MGKKTHLPSGLTTPAGEEKIVTRVYKTPERKGRNRQEDPMSQGSRSPSVNSRQSRKIRLDDDAQPFWDNRVGQGIIQITMTPERNQNGMRHSRESIVQRRVVIDKVPEMDPALEVSQQVCQTEETTVITENVEIVEKEILHEIQEIQEIQEIHEMKETVEQVTEGWASLVLEQKTTLETVTQETHVTEIEIETETVAETQTVQTETVQETPTRTQRPKKEIKIPTGPKPKKLTGKNRLYNMPSVGNLLSHKKLRQGMTHEKESLAELAPGSLNHMAAGSLPSPGLLKTKD